MRITRPTNNLFVSRSVTLRRGFTLLELMAVILIIAVLVGLLSAALNHTKDKALRISCLDNMKQLQQAWWMYASENDETLPLNQTATDTDPRFPQARSSKGSWVTGNPLEDVTSDPIKAGTLYPLVDSVGAYRCPMDSSTVVRHPDVLRTRSYSMDSYLAGDPDVLTMPPKFKFAELNRPDNVFVFIEEHEQSQWHSSFLIPPPSARGKMSATSSAAWLSVPSDRHGQGCNISFADGHIEYWRWFATKQPGDLSAAATDPTPGIPQTRDFIRLQSCLP